MTAKLHSLNDFLTSLKNVKRVRDSQYLALCPGHNDAKPSLSVKEADDKILVQCFAGCELGDILKPLGLEPKDLFLNGGKPKPHRPEQREIETIYYYTDANGKPYEVVRTRLNGFYQRRPDGRGGYINNLRSIIPTLYHQDNLKQAIDTSTPIFIVEGEKDTDRLWSSGLIATTNPMGAGKWRDSYTEVLRGADQWTVTPDSHYYCDNCRYLLPNPGETFPVCRICGGDYYLTDDNRWLCSRCHPKPENKGNAE